MSRLIDIDDERFWDVLFDEACVEGNQAERIKNELEKIVAFDTEKVIEQLEEVKGKACAGKECFSCVYNDICCEGEMSERVAVDNAIKIVLKGGTTD